MAISFVEVDVRPTLRAGGEPFGEIMVAVAALKPGQGIRLLATFKPVPLFHVLGQRGFSHEAREIGGGDWEVLFIPAGDAEAPAEEAAAPPAAGNDWPAPEAQLDLRDLDPPEPMVRILATLETLAPGRIVSALLRREPAFLIPELARRGHEWRGGFEDAAKTTYRIAIRAGAAPG